ncbi:Cobyrinic acid ac-diamide synthase [Spirochaeta thermophila DSM 6578]|uniref:Cobyrinic acid ac-diamide synthase n=1 Tax=Winmispira thermophila (strain ATCC 700085 / DSM 6578 / Z-1203) TaxID=869211 RepID=G0GBI9_WINT7|nr:P-loop NTPase [Spirochaeta thermophila]AEJ60348.1 Cobyrinic acid ac-diamide synthase [Spirochaeta thermophila DSM 6578]
MGTYVLGVASGKGGVGKTTTAVNLGLWYARRGLRVALLDLDPLANLHVVLDIPLTELSGVRYPNGGSGLDDASYRYLPRFHLLFPPSSSRPAPDRLADLVFRSLWHEVEARYDVVIVDFPPGISQEESLTFLPCLSHVLVVTTSEPTSHVSTGGYLRALFDVQSSAKAMLWFNRYSPSVWDGFLPDDVVGTYNRFAPEEMRLSPSERERILTVARVPYDATLDLLKAEPSLDVVLDARLGETLEVLSRRLLDLWAVRLSLPSHVTSLWTKWLHEHPDLGAGDATRSFLSSMERLLGVEEMERLVEGKAELVRFAEMLARTSLWKALCRVRGLLDARVEGRKVPDRLLYEHVRDVLTLLLPYGMKDGFLRNLGGMLLASLALHMLAGNPSVDRLIGGFVPVKKEGGRIRRDRAAQIRYLVSKDALYHEKYVDLVGRLFPPFMEQISRLVQRWGFQRFLFRVSGGEPHKAAYVKLLSNVLHDALHAGLGVFFAFKYSPAGEEIREGAERILRVMTGGRSLATGGRAG